MLMIIESMIFAISSSALWTSTRTTDIIKTNYALTKQQKKVSGTEKVVFVFIPNRMQFSRREIFDIDFYIIFCSSYALTMNATGRLFLSSSWWTIFSYFIFSFPPILLFYSVSFVAFLEHAPRFYTTWKSHFFHTDILRGNFSSFVNSLQPSTTQTLHRRLNFISLHHLSNELYHFPSPNYFFMSVQNKMAHLEKMCKQFGARAKEKKNHTQKFPPCSDTKTQLTSAVDRFRCIFTVASEK